MKVFKLFQLTTQNIFLGLCDSPDGRLSLMGSSSYFRAGPTVESTAIRKNSFHGLEKKKIRGCQRDFVNLIWRFSYSVITAIRKFFEGGVSDLFFGKIFFLWPWTLLYIGSFALADSSTHEECERAGSASLDFFFNWLTKKPSLIYQFTKNCLPKMLKFAYQ